MAAGDIADPKIDAMIINPICPMSLQQILDQ